MEMDTSSMEPTAPRAATHPLRRAIDALETAICTIGALALAIMAFALGVAIISRYVFDRPIPGVYDIVQLSMIWVVFLSLAYTQRMGHHIQIELITSRVSPRARTIMRLATHLVCFLFFLIMSWQTGLAAWESFQIGEYWPGLLRTPIYPSKMALFVGVALLTLRFLLDIMDGVRNLSTAGEK